MSRTRLQEGQEMRQLQVPAFVPPWLLCPFSASLSASLPFSSSQHSSSAAIHSFFLFPFNFKADAHHLHLPSQLSSFSITVH